MPDRITADDLTRWQGLLRDSRREIGESIFWCIVVPIACFVMGWICGADGAMEYAEKRGFDWDSPVVKQEKDQ